MKELYGGIVLLAAVVLIIYFAVTITGEMDVETEASKPNMSSAMQHASNVTEKSTEVSFTLTSYLPVIFGALVILMAALYIARKLKSY